MNIVFRVDASIEMGIGHVMRCLTLADALSDEGAQCHFVCREHPGNFIDQIAKRGHLVHPLPLCQTGHQADAVETEKPQLSHSHWLGCDWLTDAQQTLNCIDSLNADWLIVDHYALDTCWEKQLRHACNNIMVIDDLADRHHDCDLLLDQTFGRSFQDYEQLVPEGSAILTGAKHALLRPEFAQWREYSVKRRVESELKHLLITLGGADKDNVSSQVLKALKECSLPDDCRITVLMGATAPHLECVKQIATAMPWPTSIKVNVNNVAELMTNSDLCIGAAGSTTWERCCLGLPTIMLVIADNQRISARKLEQAGAVFLLNENWRASELQTRFQDLMSPQFSMMEMVDCVSGITDGTGISDVLLFLLDRDKK